MLRQTLANASRYARQYTNRGIPATAIIASSRTSLLTLRKFQNQVRYNSSKDDKSATLQMDKPQMMIAFTCNKCEERSSHVFSKQAYVKGTVLIECPGCKNRHLIADNLKIFDDNKINLEDILRAKGESVATSTADLAFEDIPESLRSSIGHHAKDAPEANYKENTSTELPEPKEKK